MSAEPAPLSPSLPAPLAPARLGRAEHAALAVLVTLAALLLAAWQIPPLLDWSRYRGTIATYATARLGRPVGIAGGVRLTLLPRPMLLADRVTLADRGDGFSATIGTLRLEVALSSLLAGHVVPTALALDEPAATLPWPPPRGATPHLPARVAGAFAATVNGGTLILGGIALHDITASLRTDPDTGAFAAAGNARVAGLPWRFTALLGAPDGHGVSALSLTLDGRSAPRASAATPDMQGTGGAFRGSLMADGTMAGMLVLRGPDFARLGAGPAVPWQVQGALSGDGLTLHAPALDLRLAGSPGHADATLRLSSPASLLLRADIGALPGGDWLGRATRNVMQAASHPPFAADVDVSAGGVLVRGTLLQSPHLHLAFGPDGTQMPAASIVLPGATRLSAAGRLGAEAFTGTFGLQASSLRDTLAWLNGGPPGIPSSVLAQADLRGRLSASLSRLDFTELSGTLDGSPVTGSLGVSRGARAAVAVALNTPRLPLSGWDRAAIARLPNMAEILAPFGAADATIRLAAGAVDWPGLPLRHAVLDATGSRDGVTLQRLAVDLPGGHVEASGKLAADGALSEGRVDLAAPDATALPAGWRLPAGLWQGGFHLALNGAGPPRDVALTVRADLGDLRAEAEAHADAPGRTMAATVTWRHPGAPRLAAALGLTDARAWLSDGSMAMLTHLVASPGHVRAKDFSLSAGALQLGGTFDAALTQDGVTVSGDVDAPTLTLPEGADFKPPPGWGWPAGLQAHIGLKAARVLWGLSPVATNASAVLRAGGGVGLIEDARADLPHGQFNGAFAFDSRQDPPAFSTMMNVSGLPPGAVLPDMPSPPGLALRGGGMTASADLHGRGGNEAAWLAACSGTLRLDLHGISLAGLDLAAAAAALASPAPGLPARLERALSEGATAPLDGAIGMTMQDGVVTVLPSHLAGPQGALQLAGKVDAVQGRVDLHLIALPAMAAPPPLALALAGPWRSARSKVDPASLGHDKIKVQRKHGRAKGK